MVKCEELIERVGVELGSTAYHNHMSGSTSPWREVNFGIAALVIMEVYSGLSKHLVVNSLSCQAKSTFNHLKNKNVT